MGNGLIYLLVGIALGCVGAIGWLRRDAPRGSQEGLRRVLPPAPEHDPNDLVAEPPSVQGIGMRDWITYYTHTYTWADVVREFYRRAAEDDEIASYFIDADLPALQSHFAKAMILVTSKGLTWGLLDELAAAHVNVVDEYGRPITGEVFDKVIGVLVKVLTEYKIPSEAIGELARIVPDLREALVRA